MLFFKKRKDPWHVAADRIAARIAGAIVRRQLKVSAKLNRWVNRYPAARQKQLLWLFCLVAASCIIISLVIPLKYFPVKTPAPHYHPAFIGRASDIPNLKSYPILKTDSLTNKK